MMIHTVFFIALLIFSQVGNIIRFAETSPLAVSFWRLAIAALILLPLVTFHRRPISLIRLTLRQFALCGVAATSLFLVFVLFAYGIQQTSVSNATILFSVHPVLTALGASVFLGERFTARLRMSLFFGLTGVVVLFGEALGIQGENLGHIAALASALFFSSYILSSKAARETLDNTSYTFLIYSLAAILCAGTMVTQGTPFFSYTETTWLALLALAIGPTLLGHALFTWCLRHMSVNKVSCASMTHPALAAVAAYFLFAESVSIYSVAGFALASLAIFALFGDIPFLISRDITPVEPKELDCTESPDAALAGSQQSA